MIENLREGDRVRVCWESSPSLPLGGRKLSVLEEVVQVSERSLTVTVLMNTLEFDRFTGRQIDGNEYWLKVEKKA